MLAPLPEQYCLVPTLGNVCRLSTGSNATDLRAHYEQLAATPFLGEVARSAFANLLSQASETFASIPRSFKEPP